MRTNTSSISKVGVSLFVAVALSGCSTMQNAYHSSVDTVTGWFKSDDKKEDKKEEKK